MLGSQALKLHGIRLPAGPVHTCATRRFGFLLLLIAVVPIFVATATFFTAGLQQAVQTPHRFEKEATPTQKGERKLCR